MPYLNDLGVALRNGGIGVWESPGWQSRGQGAMSGVRAIMIHHTAGGGSNDWRIVQNGRAGLWGLLSQMTFERDGGVRLLGSGLAWHAGTGYHPLVGRNNGNAWAIGIEGVSRGVGNDWTSAQRREYPRVAAALCLHYGLPAEAVIGHKEWTNRKIDPGDWSMNDFRAEVRRHLVGGNVSRPKPPAPPPAPETRRTNQEDTEMFIETAEPDKGVIKKDWPTKRFAYGMDPAGGWGGRGILRVNFGPRGGWVHTARWWIRNADWSPNNRYAMRHWDHPLGAGGTEFYVADDWQIELPPGASSVEFNMSAPDGAHIFTTYEK